MGHRRVYYIRRIEGPSESENYVKWSENWAFKEKHFNWRLLISKITVIAKLYETLLRLCFPNKGAHYKNIDFQVLLWANKSVFDKLYKRLLGSHQPAQYKVTPQTQFVCLWRWQKLLQQELHTNNNLGNFKSSLSQLSAFLIFFIFLAKSWNKLVGGKEPATAWTKPCHEIWPSSPAWGHPVLSHWGSSLLSVSIKSQQGGKSYPRHLVHQRDRKRWPKWN